MKKKCICLVALIILLVYPINNFINLQNEPISQQIPSALNLDIIENLDKVQVQEVDEKIQVEQARKAQIIADTQKQMTISQRLKDIEDGKLSYRQAFEDVLIVGDSLMESLEGYEILNSDNIIAKISASLYHLSDNIGEVIAKKPEYLILHYGLNHLSSSESQVKSFINLYTKLIKQIQKGTSKTTIVVSGIFPLLAEKNPSADIKAVATFNKAMEKMCSELKVEFLQTDTSLFSDKSVYESDGIHLKKSFYTEHWLKYIIKELEII